MKIRDRTVQSSRAACCATLFRIFFLVLSVSLAVAQDVVSIEVSEVNLGTLLIVPVGETDIRDAVLDAVSSEDFTDLSFMLRSATPAELAPIEKEILDIAKALNAASKLEVAGKLVETLLSNDIDNTQAQDLLVVITADRRKQARAESLQRQIAAESLRKRTEMQEAERQRLEEEQRNREAEETARAERERIAAEIARKAVERQMVERRQLEEEHRQREAAEAERTERERAAVEAARKVTERQEADRAEVERKEHLFRKYTASADFSPALLNSGDSTLEGFDSSGAGLNYGFRIGAHGGYRESYVSVLCDVTYEGVPFAICRDAKRSAFAAWVSMGTPLIRFPAYVSLGYLGFDIAANGGSARFSFSKAGSPTLGLALERYPLMDRLDISGRFFWLPLSFAESRVDFAFAIDLALRYEFLRFGKRYAAYGLLGFTTTVILAVGGTEKSESAFIAIGVQIN